MRADTIVDSNYLYSACSGLVFRWLSKVEEASKDHDA